MSEDNDTEDWEDYETIDPAFISLEARNEIKRLSEENGTAKEVVCQLFTENKRLRELVEAGKEDRKAIDELVDENLRLRELLREVLPCLFVVIFLDQCYSELRDKIKKELGDE